MKIISNFKLKYLYANALSDMNYSNISSEITNQG